MTGSPKLTYAYSVSKIHVAEVEGSKYRVDALRWTLWQSKHHGPRLWYPIRHSRYQAQLHRATVMATTNSDTSQERPCTLQCVHQGSGAYMCGVSARNSDYSIFPITEWEFSTCFPDLKQASTSSSSSNLHANVLNCDSSDQVPLSSYIDGISNPSINDQLSCLDQTFEAGPGEFGDLCMTDGKYANKPSTSRTFLGPISAIASKNEVGTQHGPSAIELLSEISHRDVKHRTVSHRGHSGSDSNRHSTQPPRECIRCKMRSRKLMP